MYIYSKTKEEIIKDKNKYQSDLDEYSRKFHEVDSKYNKDLRMVFKSIEDYLKKNLSKFNLIHFSFDFSTDLDVSIDSTYLKIIIYANQSISKGFSWSFMVNSENGKSVVDTNSWSGMKVTNEEQVEMMKQTYEALDYLIHVDWENLIYDVIPDYDSYYDGLESAPEKEYDYDKELSLVELEEDVVDKPAAVKVKAAAFYDTSASIYRKSKNYYVMLQSSTPKFYRYEIVVGDNISTQTIHDLYESEFTQKIKKEKLIKNLVLPLDMIK